MPYRDNMAVNRPKVFPIQSYMIFRLIFGHYIELRIWYPFRWLIKCYCIALPPIIGVLGFMLHIKMTPHTLMMRTVNLMIGVATSLYSKNKYIIDYYSIIDDIDNRPHCKRLLKKFRLIMLCYFPVLGMYYIIVVILHIFKGHGDSFGIYLFKVFAACFYRFVGDVNYFPVFMIFSLLYCRVSTFRSIVTETGFEKEPKRHVYKAYIAMYDSIRDTLYATDIPIKTQMITALATTLIRLIYITYRLVQKLQMDLDGQVVRVLHAVIEFVRTIIVIFSPVFAMELVDSELNKLKLFIADKILLSTDECSHVEKQELAEYMRHHPLEYSLWQVMSVDLRLLLGFTVLFAEYLICILQITHAITH